MKKTLKALAMALASALLPLCAGAQTEDTETMYVVKTDKSVAAYPVKDVDRVVYSESDILPSYTSCPDTCHPHAIDLGLSVKWACCNVGATKPEDYGNYYAWGETKTKDSYTDSNSTWYGKEATDIQATEHDAARANLGLPWMMPTKAQAEELVNNCTWTYDGTSKDYKVTSKTTGASIILPTCGWMRPTLDGNGKIGDYWTSTPDGTEGKAFRIFFNGNTPSVNAQHEFGYGFTVRPVCP